MLKLLKALFKRKAVVDHDPHNLVARFGYKPTAKKQRQPIVGPKHGW